MKTSLYDRTARQTDRQTDRVGTHSVGELLRCVDGVGRTWRWSCWLQTQLATQTSRHSSKQTAYQPNALRRHGN